MRHSPGTVISIRNILFPTDFSRESMSALPYALAMARKYGSKLYPVHISPEPLGAPASVREGMGALGVRPRNETEPGIALLQAQLPHIPYEMIFRRGESGRSFPRSLARNKSILS